MPPTLMLPHTLVPESWHKARSRLRTSDHFRVMASRIRPVRGPGYMLTGGAAAAAVVGGAQAVGAAQAVDAAQAVRQPARPPLQAAMETGPKLELLLGRSSCASPAPCCPPQQRSLLCGRRWNRSRPHSRQQLWQRQARQRLLLSSMEEGCRNRMAPCPQRQLSVLFLWHGHRLR